MMPKIADLFDLSHTRAGEYLSRFSYPWEALAGLGEEIRRLCTALPAGEFEEIAEGVFAARDAVIAPSATLLSPCLIGHKTEIRPGAFLRGCVLVGDGCVVGNSTELKNAVLFDGAQVPHFNYVGDSILGFRTHMGAGAVTSNVKGDKSAVTVKDGARVLETGRKKVGAAVGDYAEIGCNAVLCPGTVIGRNAQIYPTACVRGVVLPDSIWKIRKEFEIVLKKIKKE